MGVKEGKNWKKMLKNPVNHLESWPNTNKEWLGLILEGLDCASANIHG